MDGDGAARDVWGGGAPMTPPYDEQALALARLKIGRRAVTVSDMQRFDARTAKQRAEHMAMCWPCAMGEECAGHIRGSR